MQQIKLINSNYLQQKQFYKTLIRNFEFFVNDIGVDKFSYCQKMSLAVFEALLSQNLLSEVFNNLLYQQNSQSRYLLILFCMFLHLFKYKSNHHSYHQLLQQKGFSYEKLQVFVGECVFHIQLLQQNDFADGNYFHAQMLYPIIVQHFPQTIAK